MGLNYVIYNIYSLSKLSEKKFTEIYFKCKEIKIYLGRKLLKRKERK